VYDPDENPPVKIDAKNAALKERYDALKKQLAAFDADRPAPLPKAQTVSDLGPVAPPTYIPAERASPLEPGIPMVLERDGCGIPGTQPSPSSTGRRAALAKWVTNPANPLTPRVIVNRVWQQHLRPRPGRHVERLRDARRTPQPQRTARLARGSVCRTAGGSGQGCGLAAEGAASTDHDVGDVPAGVRRVISGDGAVEGPRETDCCGV
jgi:hypothetical protein